MVNLRCRTENSFVSSYLFNVFHHFVPLTFRFLWRAKWRRRRRRERNTSVFGPFLPLSIDSSERRLSKCGKEMQSIKYEEREIATTSSQRQQWAHKNNQTRNGTSTYTFWLNLNKAISATALWARAQKICNNKKKTNQKGKFSEYLKYEVRWEKSKIWNFVLRIDRVKRRTKKTEYITERKRIEWMRINETCSKKKCSINTFVDLKKNNKHITQQCLYSVKFSMECSIVIRRSENSH